jgi:hypothetical protein
MRLVRSPFTLVILLAGVLPPDAAAAGMLELTNGAKIPGEFARMESDRIVWNAEHIGEIKVEEGVIARVESAVPAYLRVHGSALSGDCTLAGEGPSLTFNCANRPPVAATWTEVGRAGRLREGSGKITASLTRERGTSFSDEYEMDAAAQWRRDKLRHKLEATVDYEEKRDGPVDDEATLDYQLDWLRQNDWYYYARAEYDRDRFSALQEALLVGVGIGRAWSPGEKTKLLLQGGPDYGHFDIADLGREDEAGGNIQWRIDHETKLWNFGVTLFHKGELSWLWLDRDLHNIETSSGIEVPLLYGLLAEIRLDYDRNGLNIPGTDNTDIEWVFALGYKW